jgi:hypothetical protein
MVVTKEADMGKKARKPTTALAEESVASEGVELPERWSVQRKTELVLRLLRGEPRLTRRAPRSRCHSCRSQPTRSASPAMPKGWTPAHPGGVMSVEPT